MFKIRNGIEPNLYFVFQVFKSNIIATYGQSLFWLLWLFVTPLFRLFLFLFLKKGNVIQGASGSIPYPLYVLFGLIFWQVFVFILTKSCNILNRTSSLQNISFSRITLFYGEACTALFNAVILLTALIIGACIYRVPPSIQMLFVPIVFLCVCMFALGLAYIIAVLSSITKDISEGLMVLLVFAMFATPSIYTTSSHLSMTISMLNPLHVFIQAAHALWQGNVSHIPVLFYFHIITACITYVVGHIFFSRTHLIALERV